MKFFVATIAAALFASANAATCSTAVLSALLTNANIDQCASDSGYAFTSGEKPDATEIAAMCASSACHALLADAQAMNLQECTLPIGPGISLLADLIDYVPANCPASSSGSSTGSGSTPATETPSGTTSTPSTTTAAPSAC